MSIKGRDIASKMKGELTRLASVAQSTSSTVSKLEAQSSATTKVLRKNVDDLIALRMVDPNENKALAELDAWLWDTNRARTRAKLQTQSDLGKHQASFAIAEDTLTSVTSQYQQTKMMWDQIQADVQSQLSVVNPQLFAAIGQDSIRWASVQDKIAQIKNVIHSFEEKAAKDPVYAYCTSRSVLTATPQGNILTRALDIWVARVSGFQTNTRLLADAKDDLAQWKTHAVLVKKQSTKTQNALAKWTEDQLSSEQHAPLKKQLDDVAVDQDMAQKTRAQLQAEIARLSDLADKFDRHTDPHSIQMRDRLTEALEKASDGILQAMTKETSSQDDDILASAIISNRESISVLRDQLAVAKKQQQKSQDELTRLTEAQKAFQRKNYDGSYSRFDNNFDTDAFIFGIIAGRMSSSSAMETCGRSYRDTTPPPPAPSYHSSSSSSSDSSPSFSSGGSFGGGSSFSTGGEF